MIKKNIMKKIIPHFIAVGIFIAISAIYFYPIFEGKILSAHDVDTWKGMSKEVQDFRNETGEEALWTKRMFSGMPAYQISTQSNGNLIQYVDKVFKSLVPKRHKKDRCLFYIVTAGLHDCRSRLFRVQPCDLSSRNARLFQGTSFSWCWVCYSWFIKRARYEKNGWLF